jgi:DNA polymerase-3 subunit delta'
MTRLDDIFDQQEAVAFISRALRADRLPHGMIFAGPTGVGKATTARALAAVFLCQSLLLDSDPPRACGRCESCRGMASGNHPDFHLVYRQLIRIEKDESKAIDLPIPVIRQYLVEPANRKAVLNNGKVFVVEEAELMNAAAQNALLKTLEEPYGKTLLLLLTDQPNQLLQTIRSRCQIVRFGGLSRQRVVNELKSRGIDGSTAQDAAEFAEGSLGLALKWIEDGVIPHARRLEMLLKRIFASDRPDASELQALMQAAAGEYTEKQLDRDKLASKSQATREGLLICLKLATQVLRRELRQTADPEALERLCGAIDAVVRAENYLESNVNVSLVFQQLAVALEGHAVA